MDNRTAAKGLGARTSRPGAVGTTAWVALGFMLVLPAVALIRLADSLDWRLLVVVPVLTSAVTFLAYRSDKLRAQSGEWRVSESTLHCLESIGGWPGAFLGQRKYRHKTSKVSFQVAFWLIVLVHQAIALDSLLGWRLSSAVRQFIESLLA